MTQVPGIEVGRLRSWLDQRGLGSGPLGGFKLIGGGTQNIVVSFERAGRTFVLRRGPLHKRESSDEAMRREAAVLRSLAGTQVALHDENGAFVCKQADFQDSDRR